MLRNPGLVLARPSALLAAIGLCCSAALGCGDDGGAEGEDFGPLVDPTEWSALDEEDDPFDDRRAADAECDSLGYSAEELDGETAFFVDTEACDYLTVEQPSLRAAAKGTSVRLRLFQFELTAPDPAEAYLAIAVDGSTLWEETIDIPADEQMIDTTFELKKDLSQGDAILFHVDNHGDNNYALIELATED